MIGVRIQPSVGTAVTTRFNFMRKAKRQFHLLIADINPGFNWIKSNKETNLFLFWSLVTSIRFYRILIIGVRLGIRAFAFLAKYPNAKPHPLFITEIFPGFKFLKFNLGIATLKLLDHNSLPKPLDGNIKISYVNDFSSKSMKIQGLWKIFSIRQCSWSTKHC